MFEQIFMVEVHFVADTQQTVYGLDWSYFLLLEEQFDLRLELGKYWVDELFWLSCTVKVTQKQADGLRLDSLLCSEVIFEQSGKLTLPELQFMPADLIVNLDRRVYIFSDNTFLILSWRAWVQILYDIFLNLLYFFLRLTASSTLCLW